MALTDKSHFYDKIKAPFMGHALQELLDRRGGKWQFSGSFSFTTKAEYEDMVFTDTTLPEEMQEIDPQTGDPMNQSHYSNIKNELPTWNEIVVEHRENLAEYDALASKRAREYPDWREQLDMLYKDIESGKLGESAKESQFYTAIKAVKDANP